ncbi:MULTISPECIES: hypothetical protein [unclassified Pseudoalteromonas]|jgi:hypothetical protein|uniref:hypothetical protein n=1 Tax=Pseudoalteromonas TaxID=53246 RepID=UPI0004000040|nr:MULTISPECIES: hypothetical protein [unclassified Pseudoalteromonas]MBH0091028.1 hypothetical protein [Pseudoalteromonas sp. NSLLW218]
MNQNRYKASFPAPNIGSEYFVSSTWSSYGFWALLALTPLAHYMMYYSVDGLEHGKDLNAVGIIALGALALFVLNIAAQSIRWLGRLLAVVCFSISLFFILLLIYLSVYSHFPIAYLGAISYFGLAAYFYNKDYLKAIKTL